MNLDEMTQQQRNKLGALIIVIGLGLLVGVCAQQRHVEKRAMRKLEQRNAARGRDFANYIFDDVKTYVLQNAPTEQEINDRAAYYNADLYKDMITSLVKDSTKYANAIVRDAPEIMAYLDKTIIFNETVPGKNKTIKKPLEKTFKETLKKNGNNKTSFEEAMKYVQGQQPLVMGPEYRLDPVYGEDSTGDSVILYYDHIPTGKTIVKGSNTSAAYKTKVNIRHLKNFSKELARARAVMARVKQSEK